MWVLRVELRLNTLEHSSHLNRRTGFEVPDADELVSAVDEEMFSDRLVEPTPGALESDEDDEFDRDEQRDSGNSLPDTGSAVNKSLMLRGNLCRLAAVMLAAA